MSAGDLREVDRTGAHVFRSYVQALEARISNIERLIQNVGSPLRRPPSFFQPHSLNSASSRTHLGLYQIALVPQFATANQKTTTSPVQGLVHCLRWNTPHRRRRFTAMRNLSRTWKRIRTTHRLSRIKTESDSLARVACSYLLVKHLVRRDTSTIFRLLCGFGGWSFGTYLMYSPFLSACSSFGPPTYSGF